MDEYISKQKAKDFMGCCLASAKAEYKDAKGGLKKARYGDYISAIQGMIDVVDLVQSADVQPVKHGRWIKRKGWFSSQVKCSLCGNFLDMDGVNAGRGDANYCPNCGADMRETNNDES